MINILLGCIALMLAGFAYVLYVAKHAPVGYQDESGFHTTKTAPEPQNDFQPAVCPVLSR